MLNISQKNLLKQAIDNKKNNKIDEAYKNLEQALSISYDHVLVFQLIELEFEQKNFDQAYLLLKQEPDLFSDKKIYKLYLQTLAQKNYFIERLQLERLRGRKIDTTIEPVNEKKQQEIMTKFKSVKNISYELYRSLYQLNENNFVLFSQSMLIDPTIEMALKMAICEDLIKLKVNKKINILILGKQAEFIPIKTLLLKENPIYQEICQSIYDKLKKSPEKTQIYLAEVNLVLSVIYPTINKYINNPDRFAKNLLNYIEIKRGGIDQQLIKTIYRTLENKI